MMWPLIRMSNFFKLLKLGHDNKHCYQSSCYLSIYSAGWGVDSEVLPSSLRITRSRDRFLVIVLRGVFLFSTRCQWFFSGSSGFLPLLKTAKHTRFTENLTYSQIYTKARDHPENFWAEAAENLIWTRKWNRVLDNSSSPFTKWFPGGELSMCYNAIDRHVEDGFGNQIAIIHDSPVTNTVKKITYNELKSEVSKFAGVLNSLGVSRGDCVLIYMPMIPQAIITMLAVIRLGAIHCLVFGGFAAQELAVRINHCKPKVIVSANIGIERQKEIYYKPILEKALNLSKWNPKHCIIYQRPSYKNMEFKEKNDLDWDLLMDSSKPHDCVPVNAMHPLYIIHTSGTTGDPKGVVRPTGGHAVMLHWSMWNIYGVKPSDTWWAASDLGWVVGHSYICYGPLLNRVTTVLYEGKPVATPDSSAYFRVISDHDVVSMFLAPTAVRAIRQEDPEAALGKRYQLKKLKYIFIAGEHCDQETMEWAKKHFKVPVLDHWWQTETGSPITASSMGMKMNPMPPPNVSGKPVPGWEIYVIKDNMEIAKHGELGRIVAKLPLPPGFMLTLFENDKRFEELYFQKYQGYYDTMDAGIMTKDDYICVMSRDDDVINVAGHRLSTSALEEAVLLHPAVVDCAVVGVPDHVKGEVPLALYVMPKGITKSEFEINKEIIKKIRETVGPVAAFRLVARVNALPKTRSGKIARKTISEMARNNAVKIPVTIEDPSVYKDIKRALQSLGYALSSPDSQ